MIKPLARVPAAKPSAKPSPKQAQAQAFFQAGLALHQAGNLPGALAQYAQALASDARHFDATNMTATIYLQQKQQQLALQWFEQALAIDARQPVALNNYALLLLELGRLADALGALDKALAIKPNAHDALSTRGSVLMQLQRYEEALACFHASIAAKPDFAQAVFNRGNCYTYLNRYDLAYADYERALELNPRHHLALNMLARTCRQTVRWERLGAIEAAFANPAAQVHQIMTPFSFLAWAPDAQAQHTHIAHYAAWKYPPQPTLLCPPGTRAQRDAQGRIPIAYLSADFRVHAVMGVLAQVFACHDHSQFTLHAYDYGNRPYDEMSARLLPHFDYVHKVCEWTDAAIARDMHARGIAIVVDLMGYTTGERPGILTHKPAPVVASFIGFPGTMGAPYVDYVLGDAMVTPPAHAPFYSEQIVRLPHCYLPQDSRRGASGTVRTRAQEGLPEGAFVFCAFSNIYKITPTLFAIWMRLLAQVPGSVLWLLDDNAQATAHLQQEAVRRGIDPQRLIFAPRTGYELYLARYRLADLFLDTLPYNALATASDALWMGLPVLTCTGQSYVGRGASSIVQAAGLPELVVADLAAYEALALQLATKPPLLAQVRARLAAAKSTAPLFDTPRYTRDLERAYTQMFARAAAGLPPQRFDVPAAGSQ